MKVEEYLIKSEETLNYDFHANTREIQVLVHGKDGLVTEAGELLENIIQGKGDLNLAEEMGDILWYIAIFVRKYPTLKPVLFNGSQIVQLATQLKGSYGNDPEMRQLGLVNVLIVTISHLADNFKRLVFYGKPPKDFIEAEGVSYKDNLLLCYEDSIIRKVQEIIVIFYQILEEHHLTIEQVILANRAKLAKRHGKKFNPEGVFNRDIQAENDEMKKSLDKE